VDGRDAVAAEPADQPLARVIGVNGAQLGLERGRAFELHLVVRLIEVARKTDDRARIYQARRDDPRRDGAVARRHRYGSGGADALDLPVAH
jgi:hypothetical protein